MGPIKCIIVALLGTHLIGDVSLNLDDRIKSDESLIVPGRGAENIILNDNAAEFLSIKGYPDRIAQFRTKRELFKDVFKIDSPVKVYFDKIYYYQLKRLTIFTLNRKISSIIGMNSYRITIDSVNLSNGVEYFVFNYGNSGVKILSRKNNKIYIYTKLGIAIFDDKNDDTIDMYVVFQPGDR
jgi:hypothetical protein